MTDHNETIRALSQITDAGLFERLATAVLRQADPALYGNLTHPGMNAEGKTVKAPVDGISFVPGAFPPHMVTTHHTIAAANGLRNKWLYDSSVVKPRKGPKPTAPPGDVIKTMSIVLEERERTPGLRVTLALTTNREPPQDLTRDVEAAANTYRIHIDIWSGSRIADYLDNDPDGQWLRNEYLGISPEKLSKQLLHKLSYSSLKTLPLMAQPESLINRDLDHVVADRSPRPVAFLVGESGLGKTIACYKRLKAHIDAGGCCLVLTQDILSAQVTLDQALDAELRRLHPNLELYAGSKARALCSPNDPLFILVEDVNRSDHPARLLERLAGWGSTWTEDAPTEGPNWHLLCPVWPKVVATTSDQVKKRIETLSVSTTPFKSNEARAAIERRAALADVTVSPLEADSLAEALGNDPLLIALYDWIKKPEPHKVIGDFIDSSLCRLTCNTYNFTLTEYQTALKELACGMLSHRRVDPNWTDVQEWFRDQPGYLTAIRHIVQGGEIACLTKEGKFERLSFRHDRVRAWLLSDAVADLIESGRLDDGILREPFFSDAIGTAIADLGIPAEIVKRVGSANSLALFYALKIFREPKTELPQAVIGTIHAWLADEGTHDRANRSLRWVALQVLSETESPHVIAITKQFREQPWFALQARFRNGDIGAGLRICATSGPGTGDRWRDRQIAHAKVRFGTALVHALDELLKRPDLSDSDRSGGLRLAGHLTEPALAEAVAACWVSDPQRVKRLADHLWAAAKCCGDEPERLLKPVCDAWAALPDEAHEDGRHSPREDLAAYEISWAFNKGLPPPALRYFINRAQEEELRWPITYMMRGIDHPDAVEFIARESAAFSRKAEGTEHFSLFQWHVCMDWERQQRDKGKGMSSASRQRLQELWENAHNDKHLCRQAFLLWAATSAPDDVKLLHKMEASILLADDVLRARLERGDSTAIPALVNKIESDEKGYWWQFGRFVWSEDLSKALENVFQRRSATVARVWGADFATDWITYKVVMRLKPSDAERLLVAHWSHLRFSSYFVQTALYVATPALCVLAKEAISQCPDPDEMLKHIHIHFGIKVGGHPGVNRIEQVEALVPYLDHIAPSDIHSLWELCNERGWFDLRRARLDSKLQDQWREIALLDESKLFSELDKQIEEHRIHWIDYWMDRYLSQGEGLSQILGALGAWLRERRSINALELVAAAIVHAGRRCDLDLLCIDGIEPAQQAEAIVADTRFAVMQRSFV